MNAPLESLVLGALMPHPPLIIPDIGGEERESVQATERAMQALASEIVRAAPDVVVVISPHGAMFEDAVTVMGGGVLYGDLTEFESREVFTFASDTKLAERVIAESRRVGMPVYLVDEAIKKEYGLEELDYGATVPLYFLREAGYRGPILLLAPGPSSMEALYGAGMCLQEALRALGRRAVILASGDNSHALQPDAPAGFQPEGPQFDAALSRWIAEGSWLELMTQDAFFLERAAEDTVRSMALLLGAFDRVGLQGEVLSYEGPFGVGYTVAKFTPLAEKREVGESDRAESTRSSYKTDSLLPALRQHKRDTLARIRAQESAPVRLARAALETYVREEKTLPLPTPLPVGLSRRGGCFVSLKQDGSLRGCMGTVDPVTENLAAEIILNAIAAGNEDDRFFPVDEDELDELVYTVDLLSPEEPCSWEDLDHERYGLIVLKDDRNALLLPNLPNIRSNEEQLQVALEKAGIDPDEDGIETYRFEVTRYR